MATVNSGAKEKAVKSLIDDVFKEFKASGDFDRFRKEYFVEITSLFLYEKNSFQNLTKNIDEHIQRLLDEQLRIHHHPSALRKNDLRELVRRRLQDNYSFNQQINMYINQIIESKIEGNLKPIISSVVDKLTKNNESSTSNNESAALNTDQETHSQQAMTVAMDQSATTSSKAASLVQQRKVSIEDFLCIGEQNKSATTSQQQPASSTPPSSGIPQQQSKPQTPTTKPKAADLLERQKSLPSNKEIAVEIKKEKTTLEEKKPVVKSEAKSSSNEQSSSTRVNKSESSASQKPAQSNLKKPLTSTTTTTTSSSSYEFMRKLSFVNEAKLQADPKKHYNFDWKLDQIPEDESLLEAISVSSVDDGTTTSDGSDSDHDENDSKPE